LVCIKIGYSIRGKTQQRGYEFASRYERIIDVTNSYILKLNLVDSTKVLALARKIETLENCKFGKYRLYNVDIPPAQSYFYEHDIFPLAFCEVGNINHCSKLRWLNKDSVWSTNYKTPDFKAIHLTVNVRKDAKYQDTPIRLIQYVLYKSNWEKEEKMYNTSDKVLKFRVNQKLK
jgi:DNA polymerase-2